MQRRGANSKWRAASRLARWVVRAWARRHRRCLVVLGTTGLAGFGISALAAWSLAPGVAGVAGTGARPHAVRVQALPMAALAPQLRALAQHEMHLAHGTVSRAGESLAALLGRLGARDDEAARTLGEHAAVAQALDGRDAALVHTRSGAGGRLVELTIRYATDALDTPAATHFSRLVARRNTSDTSGVGSGWHTTIEAVPFERRLQFMAAAIVDTSLFAAADEAGVPDAVVAQLAAMFSADVDFGAEPGRGERFAVVYETLAADGEPVPWNDGVGRVLAAEVARAGRVHRVLWFAEPGSAGDPGAAVVAGVASDGSHYGFDGRSRRRMFLASPLAYSRVSSGFEMRADPMSALMTEAAATNSTPLESARKSALASATLPPPGAEERMHLGIDYAAPAGTPVRAVGEGTVDFAGALPGYGLTVIVTHGNDHATLYAHLERIDVEAGDRVAQGRRLGAVGATGWATGPHLHFEFRVGGTHHDPVALAAAAPVTARWLPRRSREAFAQRREQAREWLAVAATLNAGVGSTGGTVAGSSSRPAAGLIAQR